jgi:hypothetical protein
MTAGQDNSCSAEFLDMLSASHFVTCAGSQLMCSNLGLILKSVFLKVDGGGRFLFAKSLYITPSKFAQLFRKNLEKNLEKKI